MLENNRVVFNNNIYDSDYEEEEKKDIEPVEWKRKEIYNAGIEDGKFEGDKEEYIKDVFENYWVVKNIVEKIKNLQNNTSKKVIDDINKKINDLKNDGLLDENQKQNIIDELKKKIPNIQKHHWVNRNKKIEKLRDKASKYKKKYDSALIWGDIRPYQNKINKDMEKKENELKQQKQIIKEKDEILNDVRNHRDDLLKQIEEFKKIWNERNEQNSQNNNSNLLLEFQRQMQHMQKNIQDEKDISKNEIDKYKNKLDDYIKKAALFKIMWSYKLHENNKLKKELEKKKIDNTELKNLLDNDQYEELKKEIDLYKKENKNLKEDKNFLERELTYNIEYSKKMDLFYDELNKKNKDFMEENKDINNKIYEIK